MLQEEDLLSSRDFSSLRFPLVGSAPSGADILSRVEKAMGVRMLHTYGSTEAGTILQHRLEEATPLDSCGRPLPGNEIKLITAQGQAGRSGACWVRSAERRVGKEGVRQGRSRWSTEQ